MFRPNRNALIIATAVLLLAACKSVTQPSGVDTPTQRQGHCNSDAAQHFVGRTATPEALEQARQLSNAERARILRPDDIVTLEYDPRRLNINTDANMKIERVSCG
ncbi:I78 family peptidase inhibitor [Stutzerimonas sp. KH-1]|jgi:hypothetical protein